jgi:hypothetical protein
LEAIDFGLAGARRERAVEVAMGNLLGGEFLAEKSEERSELREDEEAMAVVDGFGEKFVEGIQFRRGGEIGWLRVEG